MESDLRRALDEISRLQGCLNDLISVQALPAIWSGLGTAEIVNTLLDALIRMLHLDFACARVNASVDGPRFEAARLPSTPGQDGRLHHRRALEAWLQGDLPTGPVLTSNPIGPGDVRIAPWRLGLQEEVGVVVTASERPDFPTELEMVVLRVAANQAAVGLQEGRFLKWADERLRPSEAQLVQGQSLAHSGSWGWNVSSGELIFSDETFRILGFDTRGFISMMTIRPSDGFTPMIGRLFCGFWRLPSGTKGITNSKPGWPFPTDPQNTSMSPAGLSPTVPADWSL